MAGTETRKGKGGRKARRSPAKASAPAMFVPVRNVRPGTILHLGDGRRLAFGETAEVARPLAAALKRSRQARPVSG